MEENREKAEEKETRRVGRKMMFVFLLALIAWLIARCN
jgi:cell division protein FtsB